jgi:hypothetical protein
MELGPAAVRQGSRVLVHHGAVLIERFAADYDVGEVHVVAVDADVEHSYRAVLAVDLFRSRIIRMLYLVRGLSAKGPLTLRDMTRMGFVVLDEDPGTEIVLGLVGRFWQVKGSLRRVEASDFVEFFEPGYVKAAMNFRVEPAGPGRSTVTTETRVVATDPDSLRSFRRYWTLIGPFSALIRRRMLSLIRQQAELDGR